MSASRDHAPTAGSARDIEAVDQEEIARFFVDTWVNIKLGELRKLSPSSAKAAERD